MIMKAYVIGCAIGPLLAVIAIHTRTAPIAALASFGLMAGIPLAVRLFVWEQRP